MQPQNLKQAQQKPNQQKIKFPRANISDQSIWTNEHTWDEIDQELLTNIDDLDERQMTERKKSFIL